MKNLIILLLFSLITSCSFGNPDCDNFYVTVSPDGNSLYFSSTRGGGVYDIYRSDIDGVSNLVRLTSTPLNSHYPAISPDGQKIVFQEGDYGNTSEIFIMNVDGTGLTQLTQNSAHDGIPDFSPDGSKIVYEAWDGSNYPEIFTMDTDGSNNIQLTNVSGAFWNSAPTYNPTGDQIYYLSGFNADNHIERMGIDGSNTVEVTAENVFGTAEFHVAFNNDGSKIIFGTTERKGYQNGSELVIADPDGSNWTYVQSALEKEYFYQAKFHPTDGKLYYTYISTESETSIHSMGQDGSNDMEITDCIEIASESPLASTGIKTFPNPCSDFFRVSSENQKIEELRVYNSMGSLVFESTNPIETIDVSNWKQGLFFVEVKVKDGSTIQKILVDR